MGRFILYAVVAWLVFRWLDRLFVSPRSRPGRRSTPPPPRKDPGFTKKPNSDKIGDYVEFEEVEE